MNPLALTLKWVAEPVGMLTEVDEIAMSTEVISFGAKRIVAYLEDDTPVIYLNGKQGKLGMFGDINGAAGKVFNDDMEALLHYVFVKGEITLDMNISVMPAKVYPAGKWYNVPVTLEWTGSDGTVRNGRINNMGVGHMGSYLVANGPQWVIDRNYIPILSGKLVEVMKSMAEAQFRIGARAINRAVPAGVHQGFCSKCTWYRSVGYERDSHEDNEGITMSCALGKFVPFNTNDITVEMRERCGVTEDWKSRQGDAIYAWVTPEDQMADKPLSESDWKQIGMLIDNDEHPHHIGYEHRFSNFERFYDDVMWIDRIAESTGFDGITDLDAAIEALRADALRKAANIWAKKLPEYKHLFLQTSGHHMEDITPEEVTETTRKVPIKSFIDSFITVPCACGVQYKKDKFYRFQDYEYFDEPVDVMGKFVEQYG
jgi:hypothetical protein